MTVIVPPVIALTPAQNKVLRVFAADGADNATIAQRIGIAPETVKSHLRAVLDATGYTNRAALGIAYRTGQFGVDVVEYRRGHRKRLSVTHLGPRPHDQLMATRCCHHLLDDLPTTDRVTNLPARADCDGTR